MQLNFVVIDILSFLETLYHALTLGRFRSEKNERFMYLAIGTMVYTALIVIAIFLLVLHFAEPEVDAGLTAPGGAS